MRTLTYLAMFVTLLVTVAGPYCLAETPDAQMLLTHLDFSKGICAVPICGKGGLAIEIAKQSGFLVHGFDTDQTNINEAIKRAHRAKLLSDRVVFERLQNTPHRSKVLVPAKKKGRVVGVHRHLGPRPSCSRDV